MGAARKQFRPRKPARGRRGRLRRLTRSEVMVAAIHLHRLDGDDETTNLDAVADAPGLHDAVVLGFARREQGILGCAGQSAVLERHGLDRHIARTHGATLHRRRRATAAARAIGARRHQRLDDPEAAQNRACPTGPDIAQAIRAGRASIAASPRSVARAAGLDFLLADEETLRPRAAAARLLPSKGPQALFNFMRSPVLRDRARRTRRLRRRGGRRGAALGRSCATAWPVPPKMNMRRPSSFNPRKTGNLGLGPQIAITTPPNRPTTQRRLLQGLRAQGRN